VAPAIVAHQPSTVHSVTGSTISAVAWCPHPPLLVPEIAAGAAAETLALRAACDEAINRLLSGPAAQLLIIGADSPTRGLRGFAPGVDLPADADLPPSLAIAGWLLDLAETSLERQFVSVRPDGTPTTGWPEFDGRSVGLVVMGDGSARRSLKGPGYLDERAEPFDDAVVAALAQADPTALADINGGLAAELLVAGVGAWKAAGRLLGAEKAAARLLGADRRWRGEVLYADAPYGVMYVVASWLPA
jgi:hypothetical protein